MAGTGLLRVKKIGENAGQKQSRNIDELYLVCICSCAVRRYHLLGSHGDDRFYTSFAVINVSVSSFRAQELGQSLAYS